MAWFPGSMRPQLQRRSSAGRLFLGAVALAAILAPAGLAAAEPRWAPLGPPAAPTLARLIVNQGTGDAYALGAAAVWQSRGGTGAWRSIQDGLDGLPEGFAADPRRPGRLYAVVGELEGTCSVRRSDDSGGHWSVVFRDCYASFSFQDLQVDPFAADTVYWRSGLSLLRSRDAGRTWDSINVGAIDGGSSVNAFALAPDQPRTLFAAGYYNGFFKTSDGGATWTQSVLSENRNPPTFLVATRAPRSLYAWGGRSYDDSAPCFVRSDDDGATWKAYLPYTTCGAPAIDVDDPLTVRITVATAGGAELRVSHDGGETWRASAAPDCGDLYVLPGKKGLVLATDEGFFRAPDDHSPWHTANHGFAAAEIAAVLATVRGVVAAPAQVRYGDEPPAIPLVLTEDGGRSWRGAPLTNPLALAADPGDPHRLIASALRYENSWSYHARVLESLDDGHTWRGVVDPQLEIDTFSSLAVDPFEPRTLYAGSFYGGFYRSDDGGRTWQTSSAGLRFGGCHHYYCEANRVSAILPDSGRSGSIAILFETQVYTSADGGFTWRVRGPATSRPRYGSVAALARDPQGALVAVADNIYRSTDDGVTWKRAGRLPRLAQPGGAFQVNALAATPAGLFVGTNVSGVLHSTDGGRTWKALNNGLPLPAVTSLAADPRDPARLYAAVPRNGIYVIQVP